MGFLKTLWRFLVSVQLLPALEGGEETLVGGQAVLEGVMMRSPHAWAIACRKPSGEIYHERAFGTTFGETQMDGMASDKMRDYSRSCHDAGLQGIEIFCQCGTG